MLDPGLHVGLPATGFISQAEFAAFTEAERAALEAQARLEDAMATRGDTIRQDATCAPCLRRTELTSRVAGGRRTDRGMLPDWQQEQVCDCEDRLPNHARALLHAAESEAGLRPWSRLLLFGPTTPVHRRLRALAGEAASLSAMRPDRRLAAEDGRFHLVIAADCLHRALDPPALLREMLRVTAPGGCLLATLPFRHRASVSIGHPGVKAATPGALAASEAHAVGWDILAALRAQGWRRAAMLRYWSRELGYLGAHNFILRADR